MINLLRVHCKYRKFYNLKPCFLGQKKNPLRLQCSYIRDKVTTCYEFAPVRSLTELSAREPRSGITYRKRGCCTSPPVLWSIFRKHTVCLLLLIPNFTIPLSSPSPTDCPVCPTPLGAGEFSNWLLGSPSSVSGAQCST